ncbi:hypothetical protein Tco_1111750 [Tanacetum coccineum]|uniref:Uncharacterized protein n=1 Tax=Tanacetum coccineum TaxID=301880 RepID=A0ABQ5IPT3_9ASTR
MMEEYNHQISFRADQLPITKISYVVNQNKEDMLLQSLRAKFQWVINQAKKLGLPPPPALATFGMTDEDKKRKGQRFSKKNTDIAFQRESEFHLTPTTQLIRIQNQIKVDSEIADEMFTKMTYVIEARSDCIEARKIVEKNLDNLG